LRPLSAAFATRPLSDTLRPTSSYSSCASGRAAAGSVAPDALLPLLPSSEGSSTVISCPGPAPTGTVMLYETPPHSTAISCPACVPSGITSVTGVVPDDEAAAALSSSAGSSTVISCPGCVPSGTVML